MHIMGECRDPVSSGMEVLVTEVKDRKTNSVDLLTGLTKHFLHVWLHEFYRYLWSVIVCCIIAV